MPNPEAKSNPSKRLPSASLATLLIHREGLSIGVHSGFNPHPISVFFLPHGGDISSFVHLLPPNSTADKNAPSPLVVFCANSTANVNVNVNNMLFLAAFKSIRSIPYLLNDYKFFSYRSVALARIPHSTPPSSSKLGRNLITQKNENLKSADNISTHEIDVGREVQI
jgi:hypothetical protein